MSRARYRSATCSRSSGRATTPHRASVRARVHCSYYRAPSHRAASCTTRRSREPSPLAPLATTERQQRQTCAAGKPVPCCVSLLRRPGQRPRQQLPLGHLPHHARAGGKHRPQGTTHAKRKHNVSHAASTPCAQTNTTPTPTPTPDTQVKSTLGAIKSLPSVCCVTDDPPCVTALPATWQALARASREAYQACLGRAGVREGKPHRRSSAKIETEIYEHGASPEFYYAEVNRASRRPPALPPPLPPLLPPPPIPSRSAGVSVFRPPCAWAVWPRRHPVATHLCLRPYAGLPPAVPGEARIAAVLQRAAHGL